MNLTSKKPEKQSFLTHLKRRFNPVQNHNLQEDLDRLIQELAKKTVKINLLEMQLEESRQNVDSLSQEVDSYRKLTRYLFLPYLFRLNRHHLSILIIGVNENKKLQIIKQLQSFPIKPTFISNEEYSKFLGGDDELKENYTHIIFLKKPSYRKKRQLGNKIPKQKGLFKTVFLYCDTQEPPKRYNNPGEAVLHTLCSYIVNQNLSSSPKLPTKHQ